MASLVRALYLGSLVMSCLLLKTVPVVAADSPSVELPGQEQVVGDSVAEGLTAGTRETAPEDSVAIDVLEGLRSRQLAVVAEGTGDGRMILSLTNRTQKKLRVVLPPGLVASGLTGQFGGMGGGGRGGRGGRGGGGGGMGMGMGMGGGMGGGGMGMGGGGMGGMGGGGGMMSSGTMPASMGMMMVGRLIMSMVGERDSWDQTTLMSGMMGGGGMGMGMGGMGTGGMGMGMGGRGGGFRSVPAGRAPETTLKVKETRRLSTIAISLDGPRDDEQVNVPAKGERLRLGEIGQLKRGTRTEHVLNRLGAEKVPEPVAQLVLWNVAAGVDWTQAARLSRSWANSAELALAKQFVSRLNAEGVAAGTPDTGHLFWEEVRRDSDADSLAAAMTALLQKHLVLGLKPERGVPTSPPGPALSCRFTIEAGKVSVALAKSDAQGRSWSSLGSLVIPVSALDAGLDQAAIESKAAEVIDAMSAGLLGKIARAELVKGPKVKGKDTYTVRVDNGSPLIVSGLAIAGAESSKPIPFTALGGLSVSPLTSLKLPVTPEIVEQLGLKQRVRIVAADLDGL
ncbi:hypothetical protein [Singulisphaera acidiphila]|uniref:Uncharacterized protein n=1 Tax=Singulisphaera acidiphila (strain ATCC BAA-1392 / DSM 18658 / VKM B-2454 / MOB10) TaxID=886293 RepID=L0DCU5_SINAD|nr:hypothetical protein [Singulisphaera acidiphila]AGA26461.1 hypothetical protein Sinac_2127 [Singulisphaera acidiphila DSM 18658]